MSRNFVVEWNYFWLKSNNYFCWMKLLLVEVEQIFFWNKIIFGWSWIMIFVEWNYFWLKLNKYLCWMKINWVEVEQILPLNMNVQVVEFCNIWLSIVERHSYANWKGAENGFVRLSRPRITLRYSKLKGSGNGFVHLSRPRVTLRSHGRVGKKFSNFQWLPALKICVGRYTFSD